MLTISVKFKIRMWCIRVPVDLWDFIQLFCLLCLFYAGSLSGEVEVTY